MLDKYQISSPMLFKPLSVNYLLHLFQSDLIEPHDCTNVKGQSFKQITGNTLVLPDKQSKQLEAIIKHLNNYQPSESDIKEQRQLTNNCQLLATALNLPEEAVEVLMLMGVITANRLFSKVIYEQLLCDATTIDTFAQMVPMDTRLFMSINLMLEDAGIVIKSFIGFDHNVYLPERMIDLLTRRALNNTYEVIESLTQVEPLTPLTLDNFGHLDIDPLRDYLEIVATEGEKGGNLLLYGEAGTGKTALSSALSQELGMSLITIKSLGDELFDSDSLLSGKHQTGNLRLQYRQLVEKLMVNTKDCLLLIDECEDIFSQGVGSKGIGKEQLHQLLTNNAIPTIWITNTISDIPASCIRRFKWVKEINIPQREVMETVINRTSRGLGISPAFKEEWVSNEHLSPAIVDNVTTIAKALCLKGKEAEQLLQTNSLAVLKASGHSEPPNQPTYQCHIPFDAQFINLRTDSISLPQLEQAVEAGSDVRVLLLGASGTGKTALVNHLHEITGKDLHTIRCSDVMDKYIGETEKNIAAMFEQASTQNKVLFIDEVDSLLLDRSGLDKSWEVQQVNELLTQLEQFDQPFFAATNYAKRLDKAVMRRFDVKLTFDYLTSKQAILLFKRVNNHLAINAQQVRQLNQLTQLTPGDFSILARRKRIFGKVLPIEQQIELLKEENDRKLSTRQIGFI